MFQPASCPLESAAQDSKLPVVSFDRTAKIRPGRVYPFRACVALAATFGLAFGLGCSRQDPLTLVPADSIVVGQINVEEFVNDESLRAFFTASTSTANLAESAASEIPFSAADVERITFALRPSLAGFRFILVAEGNFDEERIMDAVKKSKTVITKMDEQDYYRLSNTKSDLLDPLIMGNNAISFMYDGLLVFGDEATVSTLIPNNDSQNLFGGRVEKWRNEANWWAIDVQALMAGLTPKNAAVFHLLGESTLSYAEKIGQTVSYVGMAAVQNEDDLELTLFFETNNEVARIMLTSTLQLILAIIGQSSDARTQEWALVFRGFQLESSEASGQEVRFSGKIPRRLIGQTVNGIRQSGLASAPNSVPNS